MAAYTKGDLDKAREVWDKAAGEAPGSDISRQARDALDKTSSGPSF